MSYSGGDIAQTYALLQKMYELMNQIEIKSKTTKKEIENTTKTFQQLEMVALRYIALSRRLGLPDDVQQAIDALARLITTIRMVQLSMNMLLASNPLTAAAGVAGLLMTALSAGDILAGY